MVLCTAKEALGTENCVLEDLFFPQALVLDEKSGYTVQTILTPEADAAACRVVSLSDEADADNPDAWSVHFSARLQPGTGDAAPPVDLEALRARCVEEMPASQFYSTFQI